MSNAEHELNWEKCGTLDRFDSNNDKGVYLFVYCGKARRIIYVGETHKQGFSGRWKMHKRNLLRGRFTIFRAKNDEDIYDLMSDRGNRLEYLKRAVDEQRLWIPGNPDGRSNGYFKNLINPKDDFKTNWQDYVRKAYLPSIELWVCRVTDKEFAKVIESQIQICLGYRFNIGFYTRGQNWLGNQKPYEFDWKLTQNTRFRNLPEVDQDSLIILNNLSKFFDGLWSPKKSDSKDEYLILIKALIEMGEAAKETLVERDRRVLDAKGLMIKFLYHCASAYYLAKGTHLEEIQSAMVPNLKIDYLDQASILVLARSAHETYVTFHYVFVDPKTEDEKYFRYWTWLTISIVARQKLKPILRENKEKQVAEGKQLKKLLEKLEKNRIYMKLTNGQKEGIVKKGNWRFQLKPNEKGLSEIGWHGLGLSAGLSHKVSYEDYDYFCSYAHAGSWAILQIEQMVQLPDKQDFVLTFLDQLKIYMAFMCKAYIKAFPQATTVLENDKQLADLVEHWHLIGSIEPTC